MIYPGSYRRIWSLLLPKCPQPALITRPPHRIPSLNLRDLFRRQRTKARIFHSSQFCTNESNRHILPSRHTRKKKAPTVQFFVRHSSPVTSLGPYASDPLVMRCANQSIRACWAQLTPRRQRASTHRCLPPPHPTEGRERDARGSPGSSRVPSASSLGSCRRGVRRASRCHDARNASSVFLQALTRGAGVHSTLSAPDYPKARTRCEAALLPGPAFADPCS